MANKAAERNLQAGVVCVPAFRAAAVWAGLVRAAVSEVDAAAQGVADGGLGRAMTIHGG